MSTPAALGILGGTFDPIHHGHLRLGIEARQRLGLASIRLIPAGQPPHRARPGTPAEHRLAMTELAASELPGFEVDPAEVRSQQTSYTVATLERLRAELGPAQPLVLILGADAFLGLPGWHRWRELFGLAHIAVATRPGYILADALYGGDLADECPQRLTQDAQALRAAAAGAIVPFTIPSLEISATLIRHALAHGEDARFLLPPAVLDYIQTHHLYSR
ncbi:nicotinate-nucleotide adenylyltransferase [Uliginosibacterium sp. 31-16]|uniref:nicotinate-nucleotide adenylyltransferase n=1 Tax=Uliginosibacterium sp. 31-16 TaxID=3068315 RepID=UPI00273F18B5|nr:nicotinate-nucleotide adenylyltransferase [Uliginosibacterium sp. 31-16]MDP5239083.1 nicotinate-nucleotide adenylyltransferase [Uliginosibacterium sp. 31-16]